MQNQTGATTKAAAILRENDPHSPAEQAAVDALDKNRWVLWHAEDYSLGVIRMLHQARLLRDPAHEERLEQDAAVDRRLREQRDVADRRAITSFDALIEQTAKKLEDGEPAAEVASWMRDTREAINTRHEADSRITRTDATA